MAEITLTDEEERELERVFFEWWGNAPAVPVGYLAGTFAGCITAALAAVPRLALASLTPARWWPADDHEISYPDLVEMMDLNEHDINEVRAYDPAAQLPRVWVASLPRVLDIDEGVEEWDDPEAVAFATEAEALAAVKQRMADLRAALTGEEGRC